MNYAEFIIQYNGFLLLFSAVGFLISLIWFLLTEKNKRNSTEIVTKSQLFDEKVFFGEFENLENPAAKDKEPKPIFDTNKSEVSATPNLDLKKDNNTDSEQLGGPKFIKMNNLPNFPKIKKTNEDKEVQGILKKIKKDIKNRKN